MGCPFCSACRPSMHIGHCGWTASAPLLLHHTITATVTVTATGQDSKASNAKRGLLRPGGSQHQQHHTTRHMSGQEGTQGGSSKQAGTTGAVHHQIALLEKGVEHNRSPAQKSSPSKCDSRVTILYNLLHSISPSILRPREP